MGQKRREYANLREKLESENRQATDEMEYSQEGRKEEMFRRIDQLL